MFSIIENIFLVMASLFVEIMATFYISGMNVGFKSIYPQPCTPISDLA